MRHFITALMLFACAALFGEDAGLGAYPTLTSSITDNGATVTIPYTTASASTATGALVIGGGLGVAGNIIGGGASNSFGFTSFTNSLQLSANATAPATSSVNGKITRSGSAGAAYPYLTAGAMVFQTGDTAVNKDFVFIAQSTPIVVARIVGATGDVQSDIGNFIVNTAGKGVQIKEGSNARMGTVTLIAGSSVVANTSVTANTRIMLTSQVDGGTPGFLRVSARTAATSFTITSSSGTDTSTVAYYLIEPAP